MHENITLSTVNYCDCLLLGWGSDGKVKVTGLLGVLPHLRMGNHSTTSCSLGWYWNKNFVIETRKINKTSCNTRPFHKITEHYELYRDEAIIVLLSKYIISKMRLNFVAYMWNVFLSLSRYEACSENNRPFWITRLGVP